MEQKDPKATDALTLLKQVHQLSSDKAGLEAEVIQQ